jgi:membrane protein implicated in regulation of membrane protease activity
MPSGFGRYLLWQLPGWIVAAVAVTVVVQILDLPLWAGPLALGVFVGKDLLLFPAMRAVFRPAASPRLVGRRGETAGPLAPTGYVRVSGELWLASTRDGHHLAAGVRIRVVDAHGLRLAVEPDDTP